MSWFTPRKDKAAPAVQTEVIEYDYDHQEVVTTIRDPKGAIMDKVRRTEEEQEDLENYKSFSQKLFNSKAVMAKGEIAQQAMRNNISKNLYGGFSSTPAGTRTTLTGGGGSSISGVELARQMLQQYLLLQQQMLQQPPATPQGSFSIMGKGGSTNFPSQTPVGAGQQVVPPKNRGYDSGGASRALSRELEKLGIEAKPAAADRLARSVLRALSAGIHPEVITAAGLPLDSKHSVQALFEELLKDL